MKFLASLLFATALHTAVQESSGPAFHSQAEPEPPAGPRFYDVDPSFAGTGPGHFRDLLLLPDGELWYVNHNEAGVVNSPEQRWLLAQGFPQFPQSLARDPEGGVLVAGKDYSIRTGSSGSEGGGEFYSPIIRIAAGAWDRHYIPSQPLFRGQAYRLLLKNDSIIAAGEFVNARLETNGSWKFYTNGLTQVNIHTGETTTFSHPAALWTLHTALLDHEGGVLGALKPSGIARWNADRSFDTNFSTAIEPLISSTSKVHRIVQIPGPAAGYLTAMHERTADNKPLTRLLAFNLAGEQLPFAPTEFLAGNVNAIAFETFRPETLAADLFDRILVAGTFTNVNGNACGRFAALAPDGSLQWFLPPGEGPNSSINDIEIGLDGSIWLAGDFNTYNGESRAIVRLRGMTAEGAHFLYWEKPEFRAYEKLGLIEFTAVRAGDTNLPLDFQITLSPDPSADFENVTAAHSFAPGETQKTIQLTIRNDDLREEHEEFHLEFDGIPEHVTVTRATARLIILGDETPGTRDPLFTPPVGEVYHIAQQPDDKLLIVHQTVKTATNSIIRLERFSPDFSRDASFYCPISFNPYTLQGIQLDQFGRIYVSTASGAGVLLYRFLPDGTRDPAFVPTGVPPVAAIQPDGKILAGYPDGHWQDRKKPYRLNADGSMDADFNQSIASSGLFTVNQNQIIVAQDGSIFIQGWLNSPAFSGWLRYFPNGIRDSATLIRSGYPAFPVSGNKLIIPSILRDTAGSNQASFFRYDVTSTQIDPSFTGDIGVQWYQPSTVTDLIEQEDGKLIIAGNFTLAGGQERYRLARLNADGSLDVDYAPGLGFDAAPEQLILLPDGRLLARGPFTKVDGLPATNLVLLEAIRSPGEIRFVDSRITISSAETNALIRVERVHGSSGPLTATISAIPGSALPGIDYDLPNTVISYADGESGQKSIPISLTAPQFNGHKTLSLLLETANGLQQATVRIHDEAFGSVDPSFHITFALTNSINDMAAGPDGSLYVVGSFTNIQETSISHLARLLPDGSVDADFIPQGESLPPLTTVALRPTGELLVGGSFTNIGSHPWRHLIQLRPDLSYDESFNLSNYLSSAVAETPTTIIVMPDKKLLVTEQSLRRINPDGARDTGFTNPGTFGLDAIHFDGSGPIFIGLSGVFLIDEDGGLISRFDLRHHTSHSHVFAFARESSGTLLAGGDFTGFKFPSNHEIRFPFAGLIRFQQNGTVITNLFAPLVPQRTVRAIHPLPNGEIIAGGEISIAGTYDTTRPWLAWLRSNGALKKELATLEGTRIDQFEPDPTGGLFVRGAVTNLNGAPTDGLFKLHLPANQPPVIEINSPTNGTHFAYSDAIEAITISIAAFDPDGFLENVRVELDGELLTNSPAGHFTFPIWPPSEEGEHQLTAIATDHTGLTSTNTVAFNIEYLPGPETLEIEILPPNNEVLLRFTSGVVLLSSDNLLDWTPVSGPFPTTNTFSYHLIAPAPGQHQFFRAAQP